MPVTGLPVCHQGLGDTGAFLHSPLSGEARKSEASDATPSLPDTISQLQSPQVRRPRRFTLSLAISTANTTASRGTELPVESHFSPTITATAPIQTLGSCSGRSSLVLPSPSSWLLTDSESFLNNLSTSNA
ncbi:unnamed protein product [Protopolystoma xenopodis]|uniref:Uncharacterized protein n=1 Tax=Protopolystoma xenopodis TaxID=117903 RepID=A0A3S5C509_9PLAT|nr:unnamed protein product [Protopolystoma xenopodis]